MVTQRLNNCLQKISLYTEPQNGEASLQFRQRVGQRFTETAFYRHFSGAFKAGFLAIMQKQLGNSSIVTMNPGRTDLKLVFDVYTTNQINSILDSEGLVGTFRVAWSFDGRIVYNCGMHSFCDESAIYDIAFQPYGRITIMNVDGSNKTLVTDTM